MLELQLFRVTLYATSFVGTPNRMHHFIKLSAAQIERRDLEPVREMYRLATESASSLVEHIGTTIITTEIEDVPLAQLWRHPRASAYARFLIADMPALPALLALESDCPRWIVMSLHGHGIEWSATEPPQAKVHLPTYAAFNDRLHAMLEPTLARLQLSAQQRSDLLAHMRDLHFRVLDAVSH